MAKLDLEFKRLEDPWQEKFLELDLSEFVTIEKYKQETESESEYNFLLLTCIYYIYFIIYIIFIVNINI